MGFFWYMCIFECICVHLNACRSLQRSEEDFVSSVELEVVVSAGTVNPGPLQEQQVLLPAEPLYYSIVENSLGHIRKKIHKHLKDTILFYNAESLNSVLYHTRQILCVTVPHLKLLYD